MLSCFFMSFNLFSKADQSFPLTYLLQHLFDRSHPAQIWSGNGYHFMMPMDVPVLEKISDFNGFVEPSRRLMHFLEKAITNNEPNSTNAASNSVVKSDTVSWYNCLKGGTIRPMFYLGEEVEDITRIVLLGPGEGRQKDRVHYSLFTQAARISTSLTSL